MKDDTSPVTLAAFLNFTSTIPFEWGKNDVTKEITKRTGVTIEATYAPEGEMSVMHRDKLPDLLLVKASDHYIIICLKMKFYGAILTLWINMHQI